MRNKINEILLNNIHPGNGMFDQSNSAEELTQLMCCREVRAFMNGIIYVNNSISTEEVIDCFVDTYEREQVIKAIEQVKNEYHDKKG